MNPRQNVALWSGILLAVAAGLFPPWLAQYSNGKDDRFGPYNAGYAFLFTAHGPPSKWAAAPTELGMREAWRWRIDVDRLALEFLLIATIAGAVAWMLRGTVPAPVAGSDAETAPGLRVMPTAAARPVPPPAASRRNSPAYRTLLVAVGHDEDRLNRLVEFERARLPNADEHALYLAAHERWMRDNR